MPLKEISSEHLEGDITVYEDLFKELEDWNLILSTATLELEDEEEIVSPILPSPKVQP